MRGIKRSVLCVLITLLLFSGCTQVVTIPVSVAGSVVGATVDVAGSAVNAVTDSNDDEACED
ncbi:DUF6726 family protein [Sulfurovum sp. TSL1]|uniref:DUF6726 family protein n=1 Tax=Sulfurovum sp. TSL1 TaxID=2826994 RepID=UPI001CC5F841|nr:DUF6726 family protein [Sulfurovum sp. TSL1]GIT98367.1 hypothetical protein TSL1_11880 [Sulfurovum sp. TSL1]